MADGLSDKQDVGGSIPSPSTDPFSMGFALLFSADTSMVRGPVL